MQVQELVVYPVKSLRGISVERWPGVIKPGSASVELISGEDLAPTYLEAAGVAVPKEMTGKSFLKRAAE